MYVTSFTMSYKCTDRGVHRVCPAESSGTQQVRMKTASQNSGAEAESLKMNKH